MAGIWEFLDKIAGPVGAATLVLIAWKGGDFVRWIKDAVKHLTSTVDRIEGDMGDFRQQNRDEHTRIHERIDTLCKGNQNGKVQVRQGEQRAP